MRVQNVVATRTFGSYAHQLRRTSALGVAAVAPFVLAAVVILAGALRLYHLTALSLWVDEGLSIAYSHLSWATLLGFHGAYTPHPPLYFAAVKVVSSLAPDEVAGRLISMVAGTLSVPVIYLLVVRLAGRGVALASALVLALSPLALWYSQEARPYALNVFLVSLSYLALVRYVQRGERRLLVAYGCLLAVAVYVEYSAIFALLPQVVLLGVLYRREPGRVRAALAAGSLAALTFVPWLPHLFTYAGPTSEQAQFALGGQKAIDLALGILGIAGNSGYFLSTQTLPWDQYPLLRPVLLAITLLPALLGVLFLRRRSPVLLTVAACLLLGTFVTAAAVSVVYPSFIYRTLLYAVPGWAILAGAGIVALRRWMIPLACVLFFALPATTIAAFYHGAYKQQFRLLAADTASAGRFGWPIMTYPAVTATLINVYHPQTVDADDLLVGPEGELPRGILSSHKPPILWFAYTDGGYTEQARDRLAARGYRQLSHSPYTGPLYLDLWALPTSHIGQPVLINGAFSGGSHSATNWALPPHVALHPTATGRMLTIRHRGTGESLAVTAAPATSGDLYTLGFSARSSLRTGGMRAFLICDSANGTFLDVAPDGGGATVPNDGRWHGVRFSVICPAGTGSVRIDLRKSGMGRLDLQRVQLDQARP